MDNNNPQRLYNNKLNIGMSAKSVIQNLEDSQLIRIFLEFVQTFHLQYQKIDKEISYKCHEATWILATTKATGYGRTQSEAYKHALRNLLQILIQDPPYTQFFVGMLSAPPHRSSTGSTNQSNYSTFQQMQSRVSQNLNCKQKPLCSSSSKPPLHGSLSTSPAVAIGNKRDLKTQEPENQSQCMDPSAKMHAMGGLKYETISRVTKGSNTNSIYTSSYKCVPQEAMHRKEQYKMQSNNSTFHEGFSNEPIQRSSSHYDKNSKSSNYDNQLKQALARNKELMAQLTNMNKQNQALKLQLQNATATKSRGPPNPPTLYTNNPNPNNNNNINNSSTSKAMRLSVGSSSQHNSSTSYLQPSHTKVYSHANINLTTIASTNPMVSSLAGSTGGNGEYANPGSLMASVTYTNTNNTNASNHSNNNYDNSSNTSLMKDITNQMGACGHEGKAATLSSQVEDQNMGGSEQGMKARAVGQNKSKVMVPKLKLEILPNYHKKAQKSLNDSLLAVYEQKHGAMGDAGMGLSINNMRKVA